MKRVGLIYLCKNNMNGKVYIGQTMQSLDSRKKHHINDANKGVGFLFHKAIRKYGEDNFVWSILENELCVKSLNIREQYFISKYKSTNREFGYNITSGGEHRPKGNFKLTIDDVDIIKETIKCTDRTFADIGNEFGVSIHAISDINNGKSWSNNFETYPLRNSRKSDGSTYKSRGYTGSLSKDTILSIIKDLKSTVLTNTDIAKKYDVHKLSIASINNGKNLIARSEDLSFPIRKEKIDISNKIYKNKKYLLFDISDETITLDSIAKKYKISHATIQKINSGKILFDENLSYPLREKTISNNMQKKLTKKDVEDIIDILKNTSISFERIGKLFNVTKPCIRSINNGGTWSFMYDEPFPIRKKQ